MKRGFIMLIGAALLAGCAAGARAPEAVRYDLGTVTGSNPPGSVLGTVEVQAESWLSGTAMHYRLAYVDAQRRHAYLESRWAAPPAELIESLLKRRLMTGGDGFGCRLNLSLDEFEQRFADGQHSLMILEARASLLPARGGDTLARRSFRIEAPAASADARGGAIAAGDAVQVLGDDIGKWIAGLVREKPALVGRCSN